MRFLTMQDILLGPSSSEWFMLGGYPQELNTKRQKTSALMYFTRMYKGPTAGISFNAKTQILLEYDLSFSSGIDGTMSGMPAGLYGMSGSAIWRAEFHPAAHAVSAQVVGVQTSQIRLDPPSSLLLAKATRWDAVLLSLVRKYRELETVLRLYNVGVAW
jgi:hypothetical protein